MTTPISRSGPNPYTLPDLHRRPGRSLYTDRLDPVVTEVTRSGNHTTAAERYNILKVLTLKM